MKNLVNKNITSYKNPEYKFLISLKKNRNRKSEMKSIAEGYRENLQLIESNYEVDSLYICNSLLIGDNNEELIQKFIAKNIRIVEVSEKIFKEISYRDRPDGHIFNTNIWSSTNQELISILNKKDYQILLLDPDGEVDIEEFKPNINFALVVGAEQYGISDNWFESRHTSIRIRSTNNVDSLNASTAAAIGMWELTK